MMPKTILYVDGAVDKDFGPISLPLSSAIEGTGIGGYAPTLSGWNFDGTLDEIGAWNRALSPPEVGQLFNSGAGLPY